MRVKPIIFLPLSVLLIVLGAFLPAIVGNHQDAAEEGEILFAPINDVQLKFSESDVTLREIISILCTDPETVEIPGDLTNLKQTRAESTAMNLAQRLQDDSIGFWTDPLDGPAETQAYFVDFCQPVLASSNLVDGLNNIFWNVEVVSTDRSQLLSLIIDDRTGTICSMNYNDTKLNQTKAQMQSILYTFSYLFLEELGEEFFDYSSNDILADAQSPLDNSYLASSIRWWAGEYEFRTTYFVNETGFYTYHAVVSY